jgi:hypothetical protein
VSLRAGRALHRQLKAQITSRNLVPMVFEQVFRTRFPNGREVRQGRLPKERKKTNLVAKVFSDVAVTIMLVVGYGNLGR